MKARASNLAATALAPAIWGSTYIVTTSFLQGFGPLTVALLRALPAGLLLLLLARELPTGIWWLRIFVLGFLNFSLFLSMLFISAYRLPGGVAATLGATQPMLVILFASLLLRQPLRWTAVGAATLGLAGVALLVLAPGAVLDPVGVMAGLGGAAAMALGTVLNRKWQAPVSHLTFTAWQLSAGAILLVPLVLIAEPGVPWPGFEQVLALAWLSLIGMALAYLLWFRGIARLPAQLASSLLLLSPLTAVVVGWLFLEQGLGALQLAGAVAVLASIGLVQMWTKPDPSAPN